MEFKEFNYSNLEQVIKESSKLNLKLNFSKDLSVLGRKVTVGKTIIPNSLVFHPMEGCDGKLDGSPDELTFRRYQRMAAGGAGLIWFEAVAVVHEGRANPRQLWINEDNLDSFKRIHESIVEKAHETFGEEFTPVCIMQLTHSGRFSKPEGKSAPIVACRNPFLDKLNKSDTEFKIISDYELESLEEDFLKAAILAKKAGFDGVDIKACHRYLNSELLSAFTRVGRYGEDFEGRTRFLTNIVDKISQSFDEKFIITTRLNIYDGIEFPYGWGVDKYNYLINDLTEPKKLIKILCDKGVSLVNLTMGTPYYNPHVNRPYDKGPYTPNENQLAGVERLIRGAAEIQKEIPQIAVIGTGYSWLREFSANLAAGSIESGDVKLVGYGREGFAYPEFAKDILFNNGLNKEKCCIACGKCTEIMRAGGTAGCVIRDSSIYAPIYKELCIKK